MKNTKLISLILVLSMLLPLLGTQSIAAPSELAATDDAYSLMYDSEPLIQEELAEEEARIDSTLENEIGVNPPATQSSEAEKQKKDRELEKQKKRKEKIDKAQMRLEEKYRQDRYIVKYKSKDSKPVSQMLKNKKATSKKTQTKNSNLFETLTFEKKINPQELAAELKAAKADSEIEYIQPDFELSLDSMTSSPASSPMPSPIPSTQQTTAPIKNTKTVVVAVIDTGVDTSHPLLKNHMAAGWDFVNKTGSIFDKSYPLDSAHGTHVAGIVAQLATQTGTNVQVMPLKVFQNGTAYTSDVISAIEYAQDHGVGIINCSFGTTSENPALKEAVQNSSALFICAVGNNRRNLDETPSYPASYRLPNVISVGSVNDDGGFSYFSNYSPAFVDVTALGRDVSSSLPNGETGIMNGTSMSAAYVTGVAAAAQAVSETTTASALRERVLSTSDKLANLQNKAVDGRRVNMENALQNVQSKGTLSPEIADDFDVHGYQPTASEQMELFAGGGKVVQVADGHLYSLALKSDGTVWEFWNNCDLSQVIGLSDIIQISAGYYGSNIALKSDGTAWYWAYSGVVMQIIGLTNIINVSASEDHFLVLKSDGSVWAWGYNSSGQLGDGTYNESESPVRVTGINGIVAVSAGYKHNLALKSDGTVWTWGYNGYGQLGNGTTQQSNTPIKLNNLVNVVEISAGNDGCMALLSDGSVFVWGTSLPRGSNIPVKVFGLSDVKAISAGDYHCLAVKEDGTAWAWGDNWHGQIGVGLENESVVYDPTQITEIENVMAVSAGYEHSLALTTDGGVWAWGKGFGTSDQDDHSLRFGIPQQQFPNGFVMESNYSLNIGNYNEEFLTAQGWTISGTGNPAFLVENGNTLSNNAKNVRDVSHLFYNCDQPTLSMCITMQLYHDSNLGDGYMTIYAKKSANHSYAVKFDTNSGAGKYKVTCYRDGVALPGSVTAPSDIIMSSKAMATIKFTVDGTKLSLQYALGQSSSFTTYNTWTDTTPLSDGGYGITYAGGKKAMKMAMFQVETTPINAENTYKVTFDSQNGSAIASIQSIQPGATIVLPTPARMNCTFLGWFSLQNGNGMKYTSSTPIVGNVTLYAHWSLNTYTITFDSQGGSSVNPITVETGSTLTLPPNPVRSGFVFDGWFTQTNGMGQSISNGAIISGSLTLYAKWVLISYTLTLDSQNGSILAPVLNVKSGSTVTLPTPTRANYTFLGWYTKPNGNGTQFTSSTPVTGNIIIYAHWKRN